MLKKLAWLQPIVVNFERPQFRALISRLHSSFLVARAILIVGQRQLVSDWNTMRQHGSLVAALTGILDSLSFPANAVLHQ
jgi:hypothetical protein